MSLLSGKVILIGISGGISAYKVPLFLRKLKAAGAIVKTILTENSKQFISPVVLSVLSDGVFDSLWKENIPHIALTEEADLFVILPADFNIIGKAASGIADDLLSSSVAAYNKKILFFPSMNNRMFENPVLQKNIDYLKGCGHNFIDPIEGSLACGKGGKGRLPSIERMVLETEKALSPNLFNDAICLITGGGTYEKIDPVRYLTNSSSGKMAYSLAKNCYLAGGKIELIIGKSTVVPDSDTPFKITQIETAEDMHSEILRRWKDVSYLFMSAAVADFKVYSEKKKIKKTGEMILKLTENIDILKELKKKKKNQFIVGFSLETDNLREATIKKMKEKGCDLMVGNYPDSIGSEDSSGVIISSSGEEEFNCSKDKLSWKIIRKIKS